MLTKYICQLPTEIYEHIFKDVKAKLSQLDLSDRELQSSLEDAMNSRLCDLEDIIDIKKYL